MFRIILAFIFMCASVVAEDNQSAKDRLLAFSSKDLSKVLAKAGLPDAYVRGVSRNSQGTKIFVKCAGPTNNATVLAIISSDGIKVRNVPSSTHLNDEGEIICSVVDRTLIFTNGAKIELPWNIRYAFSPGGRFFYLCQPRGEGASLRSTAEPEKPLITLDKDFLPYAIFEDNGNIFIFGSSVKERTKGTGKGLLLSQHNGALRIKKGVDLSWAGGVRDMDTKADLLLLEGKRDLLPDWMLYDIKTQKRTGLGIAKEYGLFLDPSLHSIFKK